MGVQVSVVLPAYNEHDNLVELLPETAQVLDDASLTYEIIVVDDGSTDATAAMLSECTIASVTGLRLRRNAGKSAALDVGLSNARGEYVVLMDADGQDDPREIPPLIAALDEDGLDLVTGRRAVRNDRFVKRATSRLYNLVTRLVTGVAGHDFNSGLKVMRKEVATNLGLYGELHRYIPVLAQWRGFRVGERDVEHHARRHGTSKFGRTRFWRGFLDLFTVKFLTTYTGRPFHLFGGTGLVMGLVGIGLLVWMFVERLLGHAIGTRPALIAGVLLVVVAVQLVMLGLLAELNVHLRRSSDPDSGPETERL
ncbi:MAG TPA: glycosyltransferase family 2 protein [Acidimicrobiia bacterium]|nr:glycosyltransferase family 2 protein [Acidimicrobiia bacterium]